jgi:flavin reductase (DIM6/NTAB) family NADH-FMN oxidoreductase RutF
MDVSTEDLTQKDIYKLMIGVIVPRPIAFVSTRSPNGVDNVAPFSFFNAVSGSPPTLMFSIEEREGKKKDTLLNIEQHPYFVVNMVNEEIMQQMHDTSADYRPDISEFEQVNLTPVPAKKIECAAVKESPVHLECKLDRIIQIGTNHMVLGRIVHFQIADRILFGEFKINMNEYKPVGRLGGNIYSTGYSEMVLQKQYDPDKVIENASKRF